MAQDIHVSCLINRYWDPSALYWDGEMVTGTLLEISTQTAEDDSSKFIPVGIVLLEDGTFQSVPVEFIYKI